MKNRDIDSIVIKGSSGNTPINYAFNDKVTITPISISYDCNPLVEISDIEKQNWSYRTTSKTFKEQFDRIATAVIKELDKEQTELWLDIGTIDITVTFADKTKRTESCCVDSDYFHDFFMKIKELVPRTERIPEVLKTEEDYEELE